MNDYKKMLMMGFAIGLAILVANYIDNKKNKNDETSNS